MDESDGISFDGSPGDCKKYAESIIRLYAEDGQAAPREALEYSFRRYQIEFTKRTGGYADPIRQHFQAYLA